MAGRPRSELTLGPFKRAIVVVCDGLGVGAAPDAEEYGDAGSDTLGHVLASRAVKIPNLTRLGLGNLTPTFDGARESHPQGAYGKMAERSAGKDTAAGHWEMAGLITDHAFRTFPQGFPPEIIDEFETRIGREVLGNRAASGTEIIKELGEEHVETGSPILYTSGDSVFQVAAHEEVIPLEELYRMCKIGYEVACIGHGVCRVIARPFLGGGARSFKRTSSRRDFPVPPHGPTVLERLTDSGLPVHGVGKIEDIFTGRGITDAVHTKSDDDGIDRTLEAMGRQAGGLIFTNLVDFDMLYGHRNDVSGFAANLELVDRRLPELLDALGPEDVFMLTADHGCDPSNLESTDHTREHVPLLVAGPGVPAGIDLGVREGFSDLGETLAENFGVEPMGTGRSFLPALVG